MKRITLIALFLMACTDEASTIRTLSSAGYTDIITTGYDMWACGDDDTYSTGFNAKNPAGQIVTGTVCCGFMTKGCTIRF
jgi:hypothetical protein